MRTRNGPAQPRPTLPRFLPSTSVVNRYLNTSRKSSSTTETRGIRRAPPLLQVAVDIVRPTTTLLPAIQVPGIIRGSSVQKAKTGIGTVAMKSSHIVNETIEISEKIETEIRGNTTEITDVIIEKVNHTTRIYLIDIDRGTDIMKVKINVKETFRIFRKEYQEVKSPIFMYLLVISTCENTCTPGFFVRGLQEHLECCRTHSKPSP